MKNEKSIDIKKNQFLAVQMLATGMAGRDVAKTLHVTPETISRWNQQPHFKATLDALLDNIKVAASKRMINLITTAVDAIEGGFNDISISSRDKFIMAIKFLELCKKHEIEPKATGIAVDDDIKKINQLTLELVAKKEAEYKNNYP